MNNIFRTIGFFRLGLGAAERWKLVACLSLSLIASASLASSPLLLSIIADSIVGDGSTAGALPWLMAVCAIYLFSVSAQRVFASLNFFVGTLLRVDATKRLSHVYFDSLLSRRRDYFLNKNTGRIAQHLNQVTNEFNTIIVSLVNYVVAPVFQLTASVGILIASGQSFVALMFGIYCLLYFVSHRYFTAKLVSQKLNLMEAGRNSYDMLIDSVSNISLARQFDGKEYLTRRYDTTLDDDRVAQAKYWKTNLAMSAVNAGLYTILFSISFTYAVIATLNGELTIGQFVMIATYVLLLTAPLEQLGDMFSQLTQSIVAFGEFLRTLDDPRQPSSGLSGVNATSAEAIVFDSVSFSYPGADGPVLKNVSVAVGAGEKLSITGPSGGGKSTLLKLLTKEYDPHGGNVRILGQDVRDLHDWQLSKLVGYVAQDTLIFKDSIRFNLGIADPHATDRDLWTALEKAELYEFVRELPNGLDHVLGDKGDTISGGQRQRVAFARLFLRKPRIVLLDEATSSLDMGTEARVLDNVLSSFSDAAILSVSHRPSALEKIPDLLIVAPHEKVRRTSLHEEEEGFLDRFLDSAQKGDSLS